MYEVRCKIQSIFTPHPGKIPEELRCKQMIGSAQESTLVNAEMLPSYNLIYFRREDEHSLKTEVDHIEIECYMK